MHNIWCLQSSINMNSEIAGGETKQSKVEKYQACLNHTWTKTTNSSSVSSCSQTLPNLTCLKLSQKIFPPKTLHSTHLYLNCSRSIHHLLLRDVFLSTTTMASWWWLHMSTQFASSRKRFPHFKNEKKIQLLPLPPRSCPQRGLQYVLKIIL